MQCVLPGDLVAPVIVRVLVAVGLAVVMAVSPAAVLGTHVPSGDNLARSATASSSSSCHGSSAAGGADGVHGSGSSVGQTWVSCSESGSWWQVTWGSDVAIAAVMSVWEKENASYLTGVTVTARDAGGSTLDSCALTPQGSWLESTCDFGGSVSGVRAVRIATSGTTTAGFAEVEIFAAPAATPTPAPSGSGAPTATPVPGPSGVQEVWVVGWSSDVQDVLDLDFMVGVTFGVVFAALGTAGVLALLTRRGS